METGRQEALVFSPSIITGMDKLPSTITQKPILVCLDSFYPKTADFKSEKDLQSYICKHIKSFCKDVLGDEYISHKKESPIHEQIRNSPRGRRVDILIKCEGGAYIIELKNPKQPAENRYGIGQLLDYGREIPQGNLVLVTTFFDINTALTIQHHSLPIRYIYFDKTRIMEYKGNKDEKR